MKSDAVTEHIHKRCRWCCGVLKIVALVGFSCVIARAFTLQVVQHRQWLNKACSQSEITVRVPVYRGSIYDRNGRLLAVSVEQSSVYARPSEIADLRATARILQSILGESVASLNRTLKRSSGFVWVKRNISDRQASQIKARRLRGIYLVSEYRRFYPYQTLGGQVLGFVGLDGEGLEGVEKAYNSLLEDAEIELDQARDGVHRRLWLRTPTLAQPVERYGLYLSMDVYLQFLAERALEQAVEEYGAHSGEVVILDPRSFEVLAMANWPPFDPNRYRWSQPGKWRNRAVTDYFEPGSALKVFLLGAILDEKMVGIRDRLFCENGQFRLAGHTIHDVHPHGWLTIPEVVKFSSNIGAAKLAVRLGSKKYYEYLFRAGFGIKTGIDLPGESPGLLRPWKDWGLIDLASSGFGQGVGVTPIQLTAAVAAIANDGVWKRPVITHAVRCFQGPLQRRLPVQGVRRVFSSRTAVQLRRLLTLVTEQGGTGVRAAVKGYAVAGKTGTAQVIDPATGKYSSDRFTAVFTGFIPADEPRLVITVVIHEPQKAIYGGIVAGSVFRRVASRALPYLGVMPKKEKEIPANGVIRCAQYNATRDVAAMVRDQD